MAKAPVIPKGVDFSKLSFKEIKELKELAEQRLQESHVERCVQMKAKLQAICEDEGLTLSQVFFEGKAGGTATPRYRNPDTGQTWSGRGKKPHWLVGHEKEMAI